MIDDSSSKGEVDRDSEAMIKLQVGIWELSSACSSKATAKTRQPQYRGAAPLLFQGFYILGYKG